MENYRNARKSPLGVFWPGSWLLCVGVVAQLGCGVVVIDEPGTTGEDEQQVPESVQAAFDQSCATQLCHSSATRAGELSLEAGDSAGLFTMTARAAPEPGTPMLEIGNVEGSYLALKMLAPNLPAGTRIEGTPMPPLETNKSKADVKTILAWIKNANAGDSDESGETGSPSEATEDAGSEADLTDTGTDGENCHGPDLGEIDPEELSLARDIAPIFTARCAGSGCHAGKVEFAPYLDADRVAGQLVDVPSPSVEIMDLVEPRSPDASYLWRKLTGTQALVDGGGGLDMPSGGVTLCASEMQAIYAWIVAGARL